MVDYKDMFCCVVLLSLLLFWTFLSRLGHPNAIETTFEVHQMATMPQEGDTMSSLQNPQHQQSWLARKVVRHFGLGAARPLIFTFFGVSSESRCFAYPGRPSQASNSHQHGLAKTFFASCLGGG